MVRKCEKDDRYVYAITARFINEYCIRLWICCVLTCVDWDWFRVRKFYCTVRMQTASSHCEISWHALRVRVEWRTSSRTWCTSTRRLWASSRVSSADDGDAGGCRPQLQRRLRSWSGSATDTILRAEEHHNGLAVRLIDRWPSPPQPSRWNTATWRWVRNSSPRCPSAGTSPDARNSDGQIPAVETDRCNLGRSSVGRLAGYPRWVGTGTTWWPISFPGNTTPVCSSGCRVVKERWRRTPLISSVKIFLVFPLSTAV